MTHYEKSIVNHFRFEKAEDFNPTILGKSLCMDFDAALNSFVEDPKKRVNGALGGYIYDVPQFPGDRVTGGIHYAKYVELSTSLIPQRQPFILKHFAENIREIVKPGASFFDLGPGPGWSVRQNTIPSLGILKPSSYIAVDLEPEFTEQACKVVSQEFPEMKVSYLASNFHKEVLPKTETNESIVWYPGSTLGNLPSLPGQTFLENKFVVDHLAFLHQFANDREKGEAHTRYLILLMDSKKADIQSMVNLYTSSDAVGCFRSILFKLKRDLHADDFDPEAFVYKPHWNARSSAVEHVFTATKTQEFRIKNCFTNSRATIKVLAGEKYVLANSIKPSCDEMQKMLIRSGWDHLQSETDHEKQFHVHLARSQH